MSLTLSGTSLITQSNIGTNVAGTGPAFSAYRGSSNQSFSSNTWTKCQIQTKDFDTNTNYNNTTNYRFTPTVAGYYQIIGSVSINASGYANVMKASIYKNGSGYKTTFVGTSTTGSPLLNVNIMSVNALVYFNGLTDYVELYGFTDATSPVFQQGIDQTTLSGCLVRAA